MHDDRYSHPHPILIESLSSLKMLQTGETLYMYLNYTPVLTYPKVWTEKFVRFVFVGPVQLHLGQGEGQKFLWLS